LLAALVAIPVAAVVAASILVYQVEPTAEERAVRAMGQATLSVDGLHGFDEVKRVRELLPGKSQCGEIFHGREVVAAKGRRLQAQLVAMEPELMEPSGLAFGMLQHSAGRLPRNSAEVALSATMLKALECGVGDSVTLSFGPRRTITGVVRDPEDLDAPLALRTPAQVEYQGQSQLLVAMPTAHQASVAAKLRDRDGTVLTRTEAAGEANHFAISFVFAAGCIGFFVAGLVIAAACVVNLRRREYEIGLMGSVGASVGAISWSMLVSVAGLAILGGLIGTAVGIVGAAAIYPWLDGWNRRLNGTFEVPAVPVLLALLMGVLAAESAAAVPLFFAVRIPIRTALSGRRPLTTRPSGWFYAGLIALGGGLALSLLPGSVDPFVDMLKIVVAPILGVFGWGALSPWVLDGLASYASRLPLAGRLAVRDAGRFRSRNGPVVTAVVAAMSLSIAAAVFVESLETAIDQFPPPMRDDQILVVGPGAEEVARQCAESLPCLASAPLRAVYARDGQPVRVRGRDDGPRASQWIACGGSELLLAMDAEEGRDAFQRGRLLMLDPPPRVGGLVCTTWISERPLKNFDVESVVTGQRIREPRYLLHDSQLESRQLESGPPLQRSIVPWLVRLEHPLTSQELTLAMSIAARSSGTSIDAAALHTRPAIKFYYVMLSLSMLTGLAIIALATGLSSSESAADQRALGMLGASPSLLRNLSAARAAYLALLGCVLAVPAGLMTAHGLFGAVNFSLEFVIPWRDIVAVVLGFPLLIYGGAWLVGPGGDPGHARARD
jgi:putative ABC transport system permease protein